MNQKETIPETVRVRIDLNKLPSYIGYHAPNGRIEVSPRDYPDIVEWVKERVEEIERPENARKIVGFVSRCPAVLSMVLGAVLASMYFEGEIDGLQNFHPNGIQHDILGKEGFVYLEEFFEFDPETNAVGVC